ncbi:permease-like cell division protein FtsX [Actinomadura violacea]|uniref:Permease-like cell division protein FtsX n=1 Tax=Actinomadura violacea TaxID=2819934 RepID=A0ABS3RN50_9ACTN|nr:permease-like cell division protein FtsX [Actinomadura violacea]MBO2458180.1 permease-like cell division protein FtsX [Actinomadura violacea]
MIAVGVVVALLAVAVTGLGGFVLYKTAFPAPKKHPAKAAQPASKPATPKITFLLCTPGNSGMMLPGTAIPSPCHRKAATQAEKDQLRQDLQETPAVASVFYLTQPQALHEFGGHMPNRLPPSDAFIASLAANTDPDTICSRFSGRPGIMRILELQSVTAEHCATLHN